jgi:hypothetical protein
MRNPASCIKEIAEHAEPSPSRIHHRASSP